MVKLYTCYLADPLRYQIYDCNLLHPELRLCNFVEGQHMHRPSSREPIRRAKACIHSVQASIPYREATSAGHLLHIEPVLREQMFNHSMKRVFASPRAQESRHCVPRRLHFIWLGGLLPDSLSGNLQTFVTHLRASYEFWLWGDKQTQNIPAGVQYCCVTDFNLTTKTLRSTVSSLAEQSDILRYEIIFQFGGIYVDIDSVCQKPFDALLRGSFVSHTLGRYKNIQNSMFAFPPQSEFLHFVLLSLTENYQHYNASQDTFLPNRAGPQFFTSCFLQFADPLVAMVDQNITMHTKGQSYVLHQYAYSWKDD